MKKLLWLTPLFACAGFTSIGDVTLNAHHSSPTIQATVVAFVDRNAGEVSAIPFPASAPEHAKAYLLMHSAAARVESLDWESSLRTLSERGDGASVLFLKGLKSSKLESSKLAILESNIKTLEARTNNSERQPPVNILVERLERAALADIMCHRLETVLVSWAKKSVKAQLGRMEVEQALQKLATSNQEHVTLSGLDAAYQARLAEYARSLGKG